MNPKMEQKKNMMAKRLKVGQEVHRKERMGDEIRSGSPMSMTKGRNALDLRK